MLSLAVMAFVNAAANRAVHPCPSLSRGAHACTADFAPALVGDCKQVAAVKLRELLLAGAQPGEFLIWIVQVPGKPTRHAVLVHTPDCLVLDSRGPARDLIATCGMKIDREGYEFIRPCADCGDAARASAAMIEARR